VTVIPATLFITSAVIGGIASGFMLVALFAGTLRGASADSVWEFCARWSLRLFLIGVPPALAGFVVGVIQAAP
jgi:hypothetical protein